MQPPKHVVYVFKEQGRDDLVKIGRGAKSGRQRFLDGSYTNPRMIDVVAMWGFLNDGQARTHEEKAQELFRRCVIAHGHEWFHASPEKAVNEITKEFGRQPDCRPGAYMPFEVSQLYARGYDELREQGDIYKPRGSQISYLAQRRIWIHEEQDGSYRKISHNTWWLDGTTKSSNQKPFTFNTCRTNVAACYAFEIDRDAPDWHQCVGEANPRTVCVWNRAVEKFGIKDRMTGRAGWSRDDLSSITTFLEDHGLISIPLVVEPRPKGIKSTKHRDPSAAVPVAE